MFGVFTTGWPAQLNVSCRQSSAYKTTTFRGLDVSAFTHGTSKSRKAKEPKITLFTMNLNLLRRESGALEVCQQSVTQNSIRQYRDEESDASEGNRLVLWASIVLGASSSTSAHGRLMT
jgi:hypothetical protein